MTHPIAQILDGLELGEPVSHGRLSMYPLLAGRDHAPDYLLLDEAMGQGLCQVQELTEAGVVGRLLLVNRAHLPILLLDGDLLVGARQNRVLNLTLLAPAKAKTELPVSCVEQGRWSYRGGRAFGAELHACNVRLRATKSAYFAQAAHQGRADRANQGAIWAEIRAKTTRMGVKTQTQDAMAIYATHRELLAEMIVGFTPHPGQVGALFTLDDRVLGLDLFDCAHTLARVLPRLARGYAVEALDPIEQGRAAQTPAPEGFLEALRLGRPCPHPVASMGEGVRIGTGELAANALIHAGRVLHLFAYPRPAASDLFNP